MSYVKNRRNIVAAILFFISVVSLSAQTFVGKVVSSQGGDAVSFANLIVKGTNIGAASDIEGDFVLNIPKGNLNGILTISSVGFSNNEMPISELKVGEENIIYLKSQDYNIDEVDILAESRVLYGAVKKASQSIEDNYISEPFSCEMRYNKYIGEAASEECSGVLSDSKGYMRTSFADTYKSITYSFNVYDESKEHYKPYFEGKTNMEDLLSYDLIRNVGNLIDEQNVYDYDLSLEPNSDDKIWVIHFKAKNPKLYNTGDVAIEKYEGELYIQKADFAVTKIVLSGKSKSRSIHSKSVVVGDETMSYTKDHNYKVVVDYKQVGGKYMLSKIDMTETYTTINNEQKTEKSSLNIYDMKDEFVDIKGRDYYVKNFTTVVHFN